MSIALERKIAALEQTVSKQTDTIIALQAHLLETRQWVLDEREKSSKAGARIDELEKAAKKRGNGNG